MNHLELGIGFIFGFSFAVAIICRVNLRPRVRQNLSRMKLLNQYKAVHPKVNKENNQDRDKPLW